MSLPLPGRQRIPERRLTRYQGTAATDHAEDDRIVDQRGYAASCCRTGSGHADDVPGTAVHDLG